EIDVDVERNAECVVDTTPPDAYTTVSWSGPVVLSTNEIAPPVNVQSFASVIVALLAPGLACRIASAMKSSGARTAFSVATTRRCSRYARVIATATDSTPAIANVKITSDTISSTSVKPASVLR